MFSWRKFQRWNQDFESKLGDSPTFSGAMRIKIVEILKFFNFFSFVLFFLVENYSKFYAYKIWVS